MEAVFSLILDMSLTATYVIVAILLIRLLLKKAPKKYSYALWSVAAFRLICPVSVESAFSLFNLSLSLGKTAGVTLRDVPEHSISDYIPPAQNVTAAPPTVTPDIIPAPTPGFAENIPVVPSAPAPAEPAITLMGVLAIIWCAGIAALLIYSVVTYIKLKRQMFTSVLLEGNVRQASGIRSPFILGFIRPQIYIPYRLTEADRSYVLAHERYHLRRGDHIIKPLAFLILAVHWFNPLVWLAFYLMVKDMEMSCDEKVLSDNADIRRDYSSTLLTFAAGRSFPAPSPLSFGEGSVKSRIKNILNWKKPALWLTVAAIIICIVVIAVCGTNPRVLISMSDVSSVYAKGEAVSANAKAELISLINNHSKTTYRKAPESVGFADSRAVINCEDGSSYTVHHWYCSGFSFNPAHYGEDDYYTILSRLDAEGNVEKSWKMEYAFDAVFLDWLKNIPEPQPDSTVSNTDPEPPSDSAVWEYRPELSSRSPWFVFEFDMEYESLQITASSGDLSSDGSRVNGKELSIPAGYTARWSPLGRFQPSTYAQLQFELTLNDGRKLQGTVYISSEDGTLYTAELRANGLHLSNDEEYGHAVISSDGSMSGAFYPAEQPEDTVPFSTDLDELLNQWHDEGVTTLSAGQLERLNRNFVATITGEGNPLSSFFTCYYDRPEEINLAAFLQYNFVSSAAYTEEDFYALKQQYPDHGQLAGSDTYEDAVKYGNPIHKYPREKVDEQLMRYMGITTADITAEINWENSGLVYLAEADAYFNFTSDMAAGGYSAESGEIVGDTVYLRSGFATLTLRKSGDSWLIYSHSYDSDAATTAYLANSVIEIFDVGGQMDITEYNGYDTVTLTVTDRSIAERYGSILEQFRFTKVDAPAEPIDAPRLEFTPTQPTSRLIIWDSDTPLLRYSPRGRHEYYTVSSDSGTSLSEAVMQIYNELVHG